MEKSKMMHGYEQETGKMSMMLVSQISGVTPSFPTEDYIAWLESKAKIYYEAVETFQEIIRNQCDEITALKEKAEAYDRIMSGGKKSMKEFANLLGRVVVVNANGDIESFAGEPRIDLHYGFWYLDEDDEDYEDFRYFIPNDIVDYTGDWKDSLTLPDGWED